MTNVERASDSQNRNRVAIRNSIKHLLVLLASICLIYVAYTYFSPSANILQLRKLGCEVRYGVKGGYFIVVPATTDLSDLLARHGELISQLANSYPVTLTVQHNLLDSEAFDHLRQLNGNLILEVEPSLLNSRQVKEFESSGKLRSVVVESQED